MLDIRIDNDRCTRCGLCIDACPVPCLGFDAAESVVEIFDLHLCLICRNCEIHCPITCLEVDFAPWDAPREFRRYAKPRATAPPGPGR